MFLNYFLSFIAIFVAVNALAFLPLFVTMTEGVTGRQKISIINPCNQWIDLSFLELEQKLLFYQEEKNY